ncbi:MAG TPA: EamA family transporter RarD [Holophaga sp.]|nr:EamA family transporter RarD [Holophaga sp.]HPS68845.1 EamA family transporter RarD [Holophaga sp.]
MESSSRRGVFFSLLAFTTWGCLPLFWRLLQAAAPLDILAHRILWSLPFAVGLTVLLRKPRVREIFGSRRTFLSILLSGSLIGVNWGVYIWAVNSGMNIEASLGYYMNPLFTVALGFIFLGERPSRLQWTAIALASLGIGIRLAGYGRFPLVAIVLMATFGFYGLVKKRAGLDSLTALAGETLVLSPLALGFILFEAWRGTGAMHPGDPATAALLLLAGPVTALPLWWFALGARSIPLSSVGFFQFVSPTLQLLLGVYVFGEAFGAENAVSFAFIWAGLLVYALSYLPAFDGR